jgi:hypothetical protein
MLFEFVLGSITLSTLLSGFRPLSEFRLDFFFLSLPGPGLLECDRRKEDVRVGMESAMALFDGETRRELRNSSISSCAGVAVTDRES